MRASLLIVLPLLVLGCGSDPPPAAKDPGTPAPSEPGPKTTAPSEPKPSAHEPGPPPPVPPKALVNTDAFYIISIPAPASAPGAKVCASDAACNALLPKDPPSIVRRFDQEAWVVVTTPADQHVSEVTSDGAAATVHLEKPCPGFAPRLVLWRVAPTVKTVTIAPGGSPPKCPPK